MNSWLLLADDTPFSLANLPYGTVRTPLGDQHAVVRVGDWVVDLWVLYEAGLLSLPGTTTNPFLGPLNRFAALGKHAWNATRVTLLDLLAAHQPRLRDDASLRNRALLAVQQVQVCMPVTVGDYTDFYSSREHATNVGAMFRPDNPLMPNWLHLPVAYHGRSSSIVLSGTAIRRPLGQMRPGPEGPPIFGPSRSMDYELEVAAVIGPGNELGQPIPIEQAEDHIFGLLLFNDWSARDIQAWEYQPLGPFLGKNFASTISPWVVPLAALEPFRCQGPPQEPVLPYLRQCGPTTFDLPLQAYVNGTLTTQTNFRYLYWSLRQQIAHHTIGGCNLRPGDLLASGTISGPTPESQGCLLERTRRGSLPLTLADGSTRSFLHDGDLVTLTGAATLPNGQRVGFGEASGKVLPSPAFAG
ncbi:MAG: fumarylacetoacetase [Gemmataceae bacterium]